MASNLLCKLKVKCVGKYLLKMRGIPPDVNLSIPCIFGTRHSKTASRSHPITQPNSPLFNLPLYESIEAVAFFSADIPWLVLEYP
jgi:hypothetical protein